MDLNMTEEKILSLLTPIFHEVFDDDELVPTRTMTAADVDTWDSLSHIRLIVAVEGYFNIRFTSAEVASFENVAAFVASIRQKLGARGRDG